MYLTTDKATSAPTVQTEKCPSCTNYFSVFSHSTLVAVQV